MSLPRGPAWFFRPKKELSRLASATPVFTDTSHIKAFVGEECGGPPWPVEASRAACRAVLEADEADDRLADGNEFRFFVGGIACKGVETYQKLIATAATCASFQTALKGDPSEHGAAPWVALLTESEARNGGLLKGPAVSIVGASRDETYTAAAQAAVSIFECGATPTSGNLQEVLKLCRAAGSRCPLDIKKLESALAARFVEEGAESARSLGAGTEDVAALTAALSKMSVWRNLVNPEADPHLSDENLADVLAIQDAVRTHHTSELMDATSHAERSRADLLSGHLN
jgi:hypothetical protein